MIGLRASTCTFVASITTSLPVVSRFEAMKYRTSKASFVAAWLFSSSDTRPRQKSEESTSVGRKCFRAKLDLPDPEGPTSATTASSGIDSFIGESKYPSVWGCPRLGLQVQLATSGRNSQTAPLWY